MALKHFRISLLLLVSTLLFGTAGYTIIEDMSIFDSFYMTIITISTVGFSEIKPLGPHGRALTLVIISTGIVIAGYSIGLLLRLFIEGELTKSFGRRKLEKRISRLKDHFIICGFGRIGRLICDELHEDNIDFVVIELDPDLIEELEKMDYIHLCGDATKEESLEKVGLMKARGIVPAVQSDAHNMYITLTAKWMRPDIFVLSRASDQTNEGKLKRAGATRVVSPYLIGGRRMAQILKRPTVVDFIDIALMDSHLGLMMEEAKVTPDSFLVGKNLIDSNLRQTYGVIIVAIKKASGEMIFNPVPLATFDSGDVIVFIGKKNDLLRMNEEI